MPRKQIRLLIKFLFARLEGGVATLTLVVLNMAEREGFEPPIPVKVCLISSQVHSTALPPLRICLRQLA
jgi:hypothetical protein